MNDKELISQLKKLQSVKADGDWLKANRQVLCNQIYSGRETRDTLSFWAKFNLATHQLSQPYAVAAVIVLFFVASGALGFGSKGSKPGEALYTAKMISEKAKYSVAFKEDAKTKLNLEFATERVAELTDIVSKPETKPEAKEEKVAGLKDSFKKEIASAKVRLSKSQPAAATNTQAKAKPKTTPTAQVATIKPTKNTTTPSGKATGSTEFYTAGSAKGADRLDISTQEKDNKKLEDIISNKSATPIEALDKAEALFEQADYEGAKEALKEANALIDTATK